jgi:hypothetical protein
MTTSGHGESHFCAKVNRPAIPILISPLYYGVLRLAAAPATLVQPFFCLTLCRPLRTNTKHRLHLAERLALALAVLSDYLGNLGIDWQRDHAEKRDKCKL